MKATRIITTVFIALASLAANAQEGAWNGELNIMGTKLPLVFNFSGDGCTMDSPSQGAKGIPAEKTIKDDGTIKVSVAMIGATFEGKMENGEIKGTYTQNGFPIPLTLKPGKLVVKRPQTPVAPFPYKEENISFTNAGYTFNGTLTLPQNYSKQTPVVLMVTGSGQQNLHIHCHIVFIYNFYASHCFYHVFHRNYATETTVFIHNNRDVFALFQHL